MSVLDDPSVTLVEKDGREFYLVGTAHVSRASTELVDRVIRELKPDSVAVELCNSRYVSLRDPDRWKNTDIVTVIRQGKANLLLAQLLLSGFQRRVGQQLGVKPGEEMMRALDVSDELGIETTLADRDVSVTLRRTWSRLGWWSLIKVFFSSLVGAFKGEEITAEEVERLKSADALEEAISELSGSLPEVRETLIDERDRYLASKIAESPGKRVVAVVGAGHIPGILRYLGTSIDRQKLDVIPPPSALARALGWLLPLLLLAGLAYGFYHLGSGVGLQMLGTWALITAVAGATGAVLAMAHPFTILSSFLAAPIAAIHPLIATGWVAGLVEAGVRKPRVADFETLADEITTLRGLWRNRVSRILLVVALTNLAVTLGNAVGGAMVIKMAATGQ